MVEMLRRFLISVFSALHSLTLLALPREFRGHHLSALRDTFRDVLAEAALRGTGPLLGAACAECADTARQGLAMRRHGPAPTRSGRAMVGRPGDGGCSPSSRSPGTDPAARRRRPSFDGLLLDLRAASRALARAHSLSVILALALGIGATTAVFGVVDAVLLRELPYPDAARLVRVGSLRPRSTSVGSVSPPMLAALQERIDSLTQVAASATRWTTLTGAGRPQRIRSAWISGGFFELLGAEAAAGRLVGFTDDAPDAPPVAVLSHDFWQRQRAAEGVTVGGTLVLDGRTYSVIGVLPADFVPPEGNHLRDDFDVWLPLAHFELMREPGLVFLDTLARIAPGTTAVQAAAEVDALGRALAAEMEIPARVFTTLHIAPLREQTIGDIGATLWTLMGAVALLLAIACANVANLMLTRAAERRHEVGLRVALGAGGGRIARLLLLESTLLALAGGAVGAGIAYLAVIGLRAFEPADIPRLAEISLDPRVLGFALLVTGVVGMLTGCVPAVRAGRFAPARALDSAARSSSANRGRGLLARALVATQTALALMLVIAAGLLVHSFVKLARVDVGFDSADLMRLQVELGGVLEGDEAIQRERADFFAELRRRVNEIPAVRAAHLTTGAPFSPGGWYSAINVIGRPEGAPGGPGAEEQAYRHQVSGGHLTALGLRLLQGREIGDQDHAGTAPVVVINEALARRYWPDGDALGAQVTIGGDGTFTPRTVVGVVSDARYHELEDQPGLHIYLPFEQFPAFGMDVLARFEGEPTAVAAAMREAVWSLRPDLAIRDVSTVRELVHADLVEPGFYTWLLTSFAAVALLLAGVGIYASMARATTLRTREIGIRIAVGAQPGETVRMVLREALLTVAVGATLGVAGAWATTRYLSGLLYEVGTTDPLAYAAASLFFVTLALLAAYIPARRAARVDPAVALRSS